MENKAKINNRIAKIRELLCANDNKEFAKKLGKSPQMASGLCHTGSVGKKITEEILLAFPEISRVWLLTGEGDMLTTGNPQPHAIEDAINESPSQGNKNTDTATDTLRTLIEANSRLSDTNAHLVSLIEKLISNQ